MAVTAAAQEVLCLILQQLGIHTPTSTAWYGNNRAAIRFADQPRDHRRSNYQDIELCFVGETVVNGEIATVYIYQLLNNKLMDKRTLYQSLSIQLYV